MARQNGIHVEYRPAEAGTTGRGGRPEILRVFSNQVGALLAAVDHGNKVAYVEFGETLEEALTRIEAEKSAAEARKSSVGPSSGTGAGTTAKAAS